MAVVCSCHLSTFAAFCKCLWQLNMEVFLIAELLLKVFLTLSIFEISNLPHGLWCFQQSGPRLRHPCQPPLQISSSTWSMALLFLYTQWVCCGFAPRSESASKQRWSWPPLAKSLRVLEKSAPLTKQTDRQGQSQEGSRPTALWRSGQEDVEDGVWNQ